MVWFSGDYQHGDLESFDDAKKFEAIWRESEFEPDVGRGTVYDSLIGQYQKL